MWRSRQVPWLRERRAPSHRRVVVDLIIAGVGASALLMTVLGGALLLWLYRDAGVPAAEAVALAGPRRAAVLGIVRLGVPGALVFAVAAGVVLLVRRPRRLGRGGVGAVLAAFLVLTPPLAYALNAASFRASGGLVVGVVTVSNVSGDPAIVADNREPGIGPADLNVTCARKRPLGDTRSTRPYVGHGLFVCAGYFVTQQDGYVVIAGRDRLHFFSTHEVLRVDLVSGSEFGIPDKSALGPFAPRP